MSWTCPPPRPGLHALLEHARGAHSVTIRSRQAGQHQYRLVVDADQGSVALSRDADEHIVGSGTEVTVELTADHAGGLTASTLRGAIARHCGGMRSVVHLNGEEVACDAVSVALPAPAGVGRVLWGDMALEVVGEGVEQRELQAGVSVPS